MLFERSSMKRQTAYIIGWYKQIVEYNILDNVSNWTESDTNTCWPTISVQIFFFFLCIFMDCPIYIFFSFELVRTRTSQIRIAICFTLFMCPFGKNSACKCSWLILSNAQTPTLYTRIYNLALFVFFWRMAFTIFTPLSIIWYVLYCMCVYIQIVLLSLTPAMPQRWEII